MKKRVLAGMLAFAAFTGLMTGCAKTSTTATEETTAPAAAADSTAAEQTAGGEIPDSDDNTFIITLHPESAPITCENFENLVSQGFYDGVIFHRVVSDFMAQGGDPQGTGSGGSGENIKGEFAANGVQNDLKHVRGTVSMARATDYNSASSQFFICYTDCSFLDGNYAAFGEVTQGMNVVDDFLKVERSMGGDNAISSPNTPIRMEKVEMIDDDADGNPRVKVTMEDFLG